MRHEPYARGGCHLRNYVGDPKFPTILVSDIAGPHAVPMPDEAALLIRAVEHAPLWSALASMTTPGAGLRCVPFLLQGDAQASALCLISEQVPDVAM